MLQAQERSSLLLKGSGGSPAVQPYAVGLGCMFCMCCVQGIFGKLTKLWLTIVGFMVSSISDDQGKTNA